MRFFTNICLRIVNAKVPCVLTSSKSMSTEGIVAERSRQTVNMRGAVLAL